MIPNLIKAEKEGKGYVLFNRRGTVLELTKNEYAVFRKYAKSKAFPKKHRDFFNRLCCYEFTEFENYKPKKQAIEYTQKLLTHDSEEPAFRSPVVAHLGITSMCNMHCKYCSIRQPYSGAKELSTGEWKTIIKKLGKLGAFQIGFTGGEPTLRKDLAELAEYVTKCRCAFNLTTNGWSLDNSLVRKLKAAGMRQCQVSLDSNKPEINDMLRQAGSCRRAIKAIKMLKKEGIAAGIDCVLSKNNIRHIPEFIKWLEKEKVPFLTIIKIKQGDLPLETFKELLPGYYEYSDLIETLCRRKNESPCITLDCGSVSNLQQVLREDELEKVPIAGCPVGHTLLSVAPNADIYPCVALSTQEFKVGNALKDDISALWKSSPVLKELRLLKSKVSGQCKTCSRKDHCRCGCRGIAKSLYNNLWESDNTCMFENKEVKP